MAKKHLYFNSAERLYVVEQCTITEIASRLNLAEKTVRLWKEEGNWEHKRLQFLKEKQAFSEELYVFARKLARSIMDDWDRGQKVDTGRLYALAKILPLILKTRDFELSIQDSKKEDVNIEDVIKTALSSALGDT